MAATDTAPRIHINRPDTIALRRITYCPTCKQRRRFAAYEAFWYGATWTCLGCGDSWGDGERMERPFKRGWRQEAMARAGRLWAEGVRLGSPAHKRWTDEQIAANQLAFDRPAESLDSPEGDAR